MAKVDLKEFQNIERAGGSFTLTMEIVTRDDLSDHERALVAEGHAEIAKYGVNYEGTIEDYHSILFARAEGVAFAFAKFFNTHNGDYWIATLYVHPQFRGTNTARDMVEHLLATYPGKRWEFGTHPSNASIRRLMQKAGMMPDAYVYCLTPTIPPTKAD